MLRSTWHKGVILGLPLMALALAGTWYFVSTSRASSLLERGRRALAQSNWTQADRFADLLDRGGHGDYAHLLRGESWLCRARLAGDAAGHWLSTGGDSYQLALGELAQVRNEGRLATDAAVLGAESLVHLGERRFAAQVLDTVLQRNPDHTEAHRWLAAIYIDLNSPALAIAHLREWARLDPHNGRPHRWIGWFLAKDFGKFDEAIEAYGEASRRELEPDLRAQVVKELAETLINGPAEYQAALETLDQYPGERDQAEVLTLRAQCLSSLGRPSEAIQALEAALRAQPELPQGLQLRAKMFLSDGEAKAAVPLLEAAVRIDAHDHISRQLLMQAYKQLGDDARSEQQRQLLEEARIYKDRLTKLHDRALRDPWDAGVRNQLADLCSKLNRKAEAQMWREAAAACAANQSDSSFGPSFSLQERN